MDHVHAELYIVKLNTGKHQKKREKMYKLEMKTVSSMRIEVKVQTEGLDLAKNTKLRWSGPDTARYFPAECSSHVTSYFPTFVRTLENMLCRGSNIRVKVIGRYPHQYRRPRENDQNHRLWVLPLAEAKFDEATENGTISLSVEYTVNLGLSGSSPIPDEMPWSG